MDQSPTEDQQLHNLPETIPEVKETEQTEKTPQQTPRVEPSQEGAVEAPVQVPESPGQTENLTQTLNNVAAIPEDPKNQTNATLLHGSNGIFDKTNTSEMNMKEKYNDFIE